LDGDLSGRAARDAWMDLGPDDFHFRIDLWDDADKRIAGDRLRVRFSGCSKLNGVSIPSTTNLPRTPQCAPADLAAADSIRPISVRPVPKVFVVAVIAVAVAVIPAVAVAVTVAVAVITTVAVASILSLGAHAIHLERQSRHGLGRRCGG
jgi:hypothetical protein